MKKYLLLIAAVIGLSAALGLLNPMVAWARVEGTWFYNTFILTSTQTMSIAGTETHTGAETHSGAVSFAGGEQLAIQTTAQLTLRTDAIGTQFNVQWSNETTRYGQCVSTAAAIASYVWQSTRTTANIGSACQ